MINGRFETSSANFKYLAPFGSSQAIETEDGLDPIAPHRPVLEPPHKIDTDHLAVSLRAVYQPRKSNWSIGASALTQSPTDATGLRSGDYSSRIRKSWIRISPFWIINGKAQLLRSCQVCTICATSLRFFPAMITRLPHITFRLFTKHQIAGGGYTGMRRSDQKREMSISGFSVPTISVITYLQPDLI